MSQPLISVITVSLNAARCIERAIESVHAQNYPRIEYIVVDGMSTDATLQIVERHRGHIARVVSEPDRGIYQAMNKGVGLATGDIVYFLNADDRFCDARVLADVAACFEESEAPDLLYGDLYWELPDGRRVRSAQPATVSRVFLAERTILHQTVFARRSLFDRVGRFGEDLRVVADYDWLVRAFLDPGVRWRHIDRDIAVMGTAGASWTGRWEPERLRVMWRYFSVIEIARHRIFPRLGRACSAPLRDLARRLKNLRRRSQAIHGKNHDEH